MKTARILLVVAAFGGAGVALAVGLAASSPPAAKPAAPPAPTAAEKGEKAGTPARPAPANPPREARRQRPDVRCESAAHASPSLHASPVMPSPPAAVAPIYVQPLPGYYQQPAPPADLSQEGLYKVYQSLLKQLDRQGLKGPEVVPPPVKPEAQTPPVAAQPAENGVSLKLAAPAEPARPKSQITAAPPTPAGEGRLNLQFADEEIHVVLDSLAAQGNLNILASKNVNGKVTARLTNVDLDTALAAILRSTGYVSRREANFIYVGTAEDFSSMEQSLDRVTTRVYRPNYVTAAELQTLIQPLVTERIGTVSVSSPAEAGIAPDSGGSGGGGGGAAGGAGAASGGGNKFAGGDVVLVRDYEAVLAQIDQVVSEIDVRPMQVAIEAMILSVKLDDKNQFGIDFQMLRNQPNLKMGLGNPPATLADFDFEDGSLKFGFLDSQLGSFLTALETIGDINVIATPRLMVLNKQKADILIGEQLGYVSTTFTETASSQSVSFLDVGAQLRLRPFISADGLIRMEIHPELSTGAVITEGGFTLPNKEVTQVTTNIMVRDGCTVVIGGLMRDELETTSQQLPYLGSMPVVGWLFRNKIERVQRREIVVLITPHIAYEPESNDEAQSAVCQFHHRHAAYAEKMSPLGKRSVGRRYMRMARDAWECGDRERAMRFIELSVHFDPLNRAAVEMRSDMWQGRCSSAADCPPAEPVTPEALDKEQMPDWVLGGLERTAAPQPLPLHPLDPGQPGRHRDLERPRTGS